MSKNQAQKVREYAKIVEEKTPKSRHVRGCVRAFWVGGLICVIGQCFTNLAVSLNLSEMTAPMFTSCVLIFLGTTLTGIGVYDRIGKYAAPAIEYRREGMVLGLGARLFQLAGPVLTYGISASIVFGIIYWAVKEWLL
jgi:stage V sporulation protein AC